MQNQSLPIGLFDSGIGGLTVLRALKDLLPDEDYLYLGDTARLPYGSKSPETIARYALQASAKLAERKIKLLVVACNTATSSGLPALRAAFPDISVVGVVEPGAEAACAVSPGGHIAVIATEATIRDKSYEDAIKRRRGDARIVSRACPLFAPMAEDGLVEGPLAEGVVARYLDEIFRIPRKQGKDVPDCLVLGCTHFPLLQRAIANVAGPGVALVDSAATTAQAVAAILEKDGLRNPAGKGKMRFLTTDDSARFARMGAYFLGRPVPREQVELVELSCPA